MALATAAVGVAVSTASTSTRPDRAVQARLDGTRLTWSAPQFHGGMLSSATLTGTPTVLNFYASWCTVCLHEMPAFEAVSVQFGSRVHVVGVNPQGNDSDAAQADMVRRTGVTYPTVRDHTETLLRLFNTTGALPTTVFISAAGQVVGVHNGGLSRDDLVSAMHQLFGV